MKFSHYLRKYKTNHEGPSLEECSANGEPCVTKLYYAAGVVLKDHLPEMLALVKEPKYLKLHSVQATGIPVYSRLFSI